MPKIFRLLILTSLLAVLPGLADELKLINQQVLKPDNLSASFTQNKHLKILKTPLVSSGRFWISQSDGVVWRVEKPFPSEVVITGNGVSFSDKQSQKTAKSMEYVGKLLHSLLSGDLVKITEQFTVTIGSSGNDGQDWELALVPQSALMRKGIESISLSGNRFISGLVLHEASGDRTEIIFQDARAVGSLPAEVLHAFGKH